MKKTKLDITGMHCASCSTLINRALNKVDGVVKANVNLTTNKATVEFDENKTNVPKLIEVVKSKGYGVAEAIGKTDYDREARKRKRELKTIKHTFYYSLVYAIPVFILGMFFMIAPFRG